MYAPHEVSENETTAPHEADSTPLGHFVRTVRKYRLVIAVTVAAVMILYALGGIYTYLTSAGHEVTTVPFRLDFEGADRGEYPNGTRFSTAEITADPILQKVFGDNRLGQYLNENDFRRSIVVLESNRALEQLMLEYQSKLSDPRLTPVDRERIEREFDQKRTSISKSDYSISFVQERGTRRVPRTVVKKVLVDILASWARYAAVEKRALDYRVPVLSVRILDRASLAGTDPIVALAILRTKVSEVLESITVIAKIPGADLVRTRDGQSLSEVKLGVEDLLRFEIEPLILTARAQPGANVQEAVRFLQAQLAYDERMLAAARMKETALRGALSAYEQQRLVREQTPRDAAQPRMPTQGEAVMPQVTESFLDRLIEMSNQRADREYRQRLVDEIKQASLDIVPMETAVAYDRALLDALTRGTGGGAAEPAAIGRRLQSAFEAAAVSIRQASEIHQTASRQLNPVTELYSMTGPPAMRIERSVALTRLGWWGILLLLVLIPMVTALTYLYERAREEETLDERLHPEVGAAEEGRTAGAQAGGNARTAV